MSNGLNTLPDTSSGLAIDNQSLGNLRFKAHENPNQALPKVAKQFEAIFVNMMLKSMRNTIPEDSLGNSKQTKMFTGLLDKQLAQNIAQGHGLGLADLIVKQLSPHSSIPSPVHRFGQNTPPPALPLHPPHNFTQVTPTHADKPFTKGLKTPQQDVHHD